LRYGVARTPALLVPIWTHSRKQIAVWFDDVMDYVSAWAARKFAGLLTAFRAVSWRFWFDLANKPVNVRPLVAMSRARTRRRNPRTGQRSKWTRARDRRDHSRWEADDGSGAVSLHVIRLEKPAWLSASEAASM
jgi:hypothetical protein